MSEFVQVTLAVLLFRTIMVLVGFALAFLGYQLFLKGVYEKAGELKAAWGDRNLALKQAAPGTFFALFGVIVVGISVFRGTDLQSTSIPASPALAGTPSTQSSSTLATALLSDSSVREANETSMSLAKKIGLGVDDGSPVTAKPLISNDDRLKAIVKKIVDEKVKDEEALDMVFLATLARFPTDEERTTMRDVQSKSESSQQFYDDLVWSIANSKEYILHHKETGK